MQEVVPDVLSGFPFQRMFSVLPLYPRGLSLHNQPERGKISVF
jgi:hypothetical protein